MFVESAESLRGALVVGLDDLACFLHFLLFLCPRLPLVLLYDCLDQVTHVCTTDMCVHTPYNQHRSRE